MQADTVQKRLESLASLSMAGKCVNGLTRLLTSQALMEYSVNKTRRNAGISTPGVDGETLDGLSMERINGYLRSMVDGSYQTKPVKRVFIPKANGKLRPLGIPTYADRMVQNGQREILQRIYEPIFSDRSHGFRPGRSCHTALAQGQCLWTANKWFVEVDIKGFFDNINHETLLNLLRKRINDEPFVATVRAQLQAGVMEKMSAETRKNKRGGRWQHRPSYSGTPQGGIVSPILANIYLHELDMFMEAETLSFHRGKKRRENPEYDRYMARIVLRRRKIKKLDAEGVDTPERAKLIAEVQELSKTMRGLVSKDPMDPDYRRLNYVRYADDFLIGVIGSKADAAAVLEKVQAFLKNTLLLDVAEDKTGIVKATDGVRFLGYDLKTFTGTKVAKVRRGDFVFTKRPPAERIILVTPWDKQRAFCERHGYGDFATAKGRHRGEMIHSSDYEIVSIFNAELRGFANYYRMDTWIRSRMGQLAWVANQSLVKTLASKHRLPQHRILSRITRGRGKQAVTHVGKNGKKLEVAVWWPRDIKLLGKAAREVDVDREPLGISLALGRTDVTMRLLAGECENEHCTSPSGTPLQVHHVRALANVGQSPTLEWLASARTRKTRYLCVKCHPMVKTNARQRNVKYVNGEPDEGKLSSPVLGEGALRSGSA